MQSQTAAGDVTAKQEASAGQGNSSQRCTYGRQWCHIARGVKLEQTDSANKSKLSAAYAWAHNLQLSSPLGQHILERSPGIALL